MNAIAPQLRKRFREAKATVEAATVPNAIFALYCFFVLDYFARLAARFPVWGMLRPTLILVALLAFAAFLHVDKFRGVMREPTVRILLFFLLYLLLSFPLVEWPGSIIRHNLPEFVKAAVFLFFTAFFVDTDRRLKVFLALFVGLQFLRVLEPLYLNVTTGYLSGGYYIGGGEFAGRLSGARADVINPNGLAFVIATTLAYAHFVLWWSPSKALKLVYLLYVPAALYALVLTGSRGGFLAALVVVGMMFWYSRHKAVFLVVALVVAFGAWSQLDDTQRERYSSLIDSESSQHGTVDGRLEGIKEEFRLGLNRPIFGHGLGTTPEVKVNFGSGRKQAAHNLYAEALIETGIIGFLIFMAFLLSCYKLLAANMKRFRELGSDYASPSNFHFRLNLALITVFWMYVFYSYNYFGLSQEYWYLFAGLCVAFSRSIQRNLDDDARPAPATEARPQHRFGNGQLA